MLKAEKIKFFLDGEEISCIAYDIDGYYDSIIIVTIKRYAKIDGEVQLFNKNAITITNTYGVKVIRRSDDGIEFYLDEIK